MPATHAFFSGASARAHAFPAMLARSAAYVRARYAHLPRPRAALPASTSTNSSCPLRKRRPSPTISPAHTQAELLQDGQPGRRWPRAPRSRAALRGFDLLLRVKRWAAPSRPSCARGSLDRARTPCRCRRTAPASARSPRPQALHFANLCVMSTMPPFRMRHLCEHAEHVVRLLGGKHTGRLVEDMMRLPR